MGGWAGGWVGGGGCRGGGLVNRRTDDWTDTTGRTDDKYSFEASSTALGRELLYQI